MEEQKRRQQRKEEMRRRRQRQVRRQLMMLGTAAVLILIVVIVVIVRAWNGHQDRKELEQQTETVQAALAAGYEEFTAQTAADGASTGEAADSSGADEAADSSSTGEAAGDGSSDGEAVEAAAMDTDSAGRGAESGQNSGAEEFAQWVTEKYPDAVSGSLSDAASDGKITDAEAYDALGATMHVLQDGYRGWLDDAGTAAEHGIYIKSAEAESETATVSIAGDLCLEEDGFVLDKYDESGELSQCISPEILDITNGADIFYLNHEYTVSERGEALAGKLYTFRAQPERMALLTEMGTDLVSLANNHIYDYGEEAMLDTMDYLDEAGIPYVGGGRNLAEAERPAYFIVNGMKIGFVAASNAELTLYTPAAGEDSAGILEAYDTTLYDQVIADAAKECDYLIAYIHWGPEDTNQYAEYQTAQGKEFLDAGADIVVGGHPHVLQGMEYMDGKPVIYSMGDFWFNDETKYTGLLNLEITPEGLSEMSFTPCLQTGLTTQYISDAAEQREMYDFLESLSPNAQISDDGVITEITG